MKVNEGGKIWLLEYEKVMRKILKGNGEEGTIDKNNLYLERGPTRPRFFSVDIIRRRARASSPVRKRKVVSKKLFPKIGKLSRELLELRESKNLMRKILERDYSKY